jgi:prepilin-type processing-associated H-X9-DG protein
MTWGVTGSNDSDNTNPATITQASLGPYVSKVTSIYHCPSDHALSADQRAAGWVNRIRSYSMNAMVGNAGTASASGVNINNPHYKQFFKLGQISHPTEIFVFVEEHPDSIGDGYFLPVFRLGANGYSSYSDEWNELPASYHNRSATFSFADGHASLHRWLRSSTIRPPLANAAQLPIQIPATPAGENADFNWTTVHLSVAN